MSVLYPLPLRTDCTRRKTRKRNSAFKFIFFFLITSLSFQVIFAQEEKEIQNRKEAELKKQEAEQTELKLKANPKLKERLEATRQLKPLTLELTQLEQQKISDQQLAEQKARYVAKQAEQDRAGVSLPGVEYKVITNGNQVEYVVTNAGSVIFKQQINSSASLYDRQAQAEKEAIYASNRLRENNNYPIDALRTEIKSLVSQAAAAVPAARSNNNQRTTADYTFNGGGGSIPATGTSGIASPYPATINVSGVPAGATVKEVKLNGLSHTWSDDVDIVLQSPTGTNVVIMSDAGGAGILSNVNYTFNDAAAVSLADGTGNPSGTYKPTNYDVADNWPAPGPGAAATAVTLSTFGNGNQNGTWSLYIFDDVGGDAGNWGTWSITFTDPPAVCFPITLTGQPANATICAGANGTFTVAATPPGVSYNWQVNTGSGFVYITNGGVYSGATTATLTITGATLAMNGYQYRAVVTCSGGGLPEISNPATLTVNVSPSPPGVTPTAASICPGGSVALNTTASTIGISGTISAAIPDNSATGVTSTINVSGFPAVPVGSVSVTFNITHTWDGDLDINLVAPNGNILNLVNNRGGSGDNFVNTVISSNGVTAIASGVSPFTGTYLPDAALTQGPTGFVSNVALFSDLFSIPNGNWTLAIRDGATGDVGTLTSWSINITPVGGVPPPAVWSPVSGLFNDAGLTSPYVAGTYQTTVYASPAVTTTYSATVTNGTCNSAASTVVVTVNALPVITTQPGSGNACAGSTKTFSVAATGTGLTYQWQVDMGGGFVNITTGTPTNPSGFIYTGQTTNTLSINDVLATMNGYKYRAVVSGACTPAATSTDVTLVVNSVPAISIASSSQCAPTTLTASGANTYTWTPSAGLSATTGSVVTANPTANSTYTVTGTVTATGCSNSTQVDVKFTPPIPTVAPTAPIICFGAVQQLSITSSSLPPVANTTSSGPITVPIPDNEFVNGANHSLTVSGVTGAVQSISVTFNISHTWDADLDINLVAPNGNILNLVGARGGSGDNFTNTTISSASTTSLATGAAPFTGTFAADGNIGWGPFSYASNVSTFASLFSVPNGTWRLAIADFALGDPGTLTSWSITINYATPDAGIWTPVTGLFTNAAGTTPYVAGTPAATVYASPAVTTTYSVNVTNTSTERRVFSSGGGVTIPGVALGSTSAGAAGPYPSTISVAGLPTNAIIKSVTLKGVRHSFPDDLDILIQSPTGTNVVLMSDVGGSADATGQSYTFDDAAVGLMADAALNGTGTYKPTNIGASDTYPAPVGAITQGTPTLSSITGDPNGVWNLYVSDGFAGDIGSISSWEIAFTLPTAVNCTSTPRTVTVTVHSPIIFTTQPQNRTACQNGTVTFTAAATGTISTTQWQVSTNGGTTWTNISGATTTTLTLTNVQPSQNGYRYRLVLSNAGCGTVNSNAAILTVNPLPTVSLNMNPAGQTQLRPGMLTTVTVSSTPAGASYQWFINGVAQPSITGSSYAVDAYHLGTYTVTVTDVNGCVNTTSGITFTALPTSNLFIYPNPTTGAFYVTYYMPTAGTRVTMTLIDMMGRRLVERHETTSAPYTRFDFSSSNLAAGVYIIEFRNPGGDLLDKGQLVVTR